jgi:hypothetical protein
VIFPNLSLCRIIYFFFELFSEVLLPSPLWSNHERFRYLLVELQLWVMITIQLLSNITLGTLGSIWQLHADTPTSKARFIRYLAWNAVVTRLAIKQDDLQLTESVIVVEAGWFGCLLSWTELVWILLLLLHKLVGFMAVSYMGCYLRIRWFGVVAVVVAGSGIVSKIEVKEVPFVLKLGCS